MSPSTLFLVRPLVPIEHLKIKSLAEENRRKVEERELEFDNKLRLERAKHEELKKDNTLQVLSKKPFIPTDNEVSLNKRSRSAKMRVGEKIG